MANLDWTKDWSSADDGTILTGSHLADIQSDLAAVLKALSDGNIDSAAAILESKIAFNITTGHHHDGINSRTIATSTFVAQNFRSGCFIRRTGNDTLSVTAGRCEIGGTVYSKTSATTLTGSTAGDYITGTEPTSSTIFIYAYNNSGTLGFKMHTAAPNLSDASDNTAEEPWRYLKNGSTYYRCVGAIFNDASQNFAIGSDVNFDASSFTSGRLVGTGAAQTLTTIWTPDLVMAIGASQDSTPAAAENAGGLVFAHKRLLDDSTLVIEGFGAAAAAAAYRATTDTWTSSDGGGITVTAQAAGTAGSFSTTAITSGLLVYWWAFTKERF